MALVGEHHIDPPPAAQMWEAGTRALHQATAMAGKKGPVGVLTELPHPEQPLDNPESRREYLTRVVTRDAVARLQAATAAKSGDLLWIFVERMTPQGTPMVSARDLKRDESLRANRYVGTGIAVGNDQAIGYPYIAALVGGRGPMEQAGGKQGDRIVRIDDHDAHSMPVTRVVELLGGDEGTTVTVELRTPSDNASRKAVVTRGRIRLPSVAGIEESGPNSADHRVKADPRIRYVRVNQIKGSTAHELQRLERQFRADGGRAVIIDLRGTEDRDLHNAVLVADALMDGGVIGRLRTKERVQEFRADRECLFRGMHLAVLVDQNTTGSGEWIAAALQDNHAALAIGEPTAGNPFVSTFIQVPGEDEFVSMATGLFERPSGQPFQRLPDGAANAMGGIVPDRIVKSIEPEPAIAGVIQLVQQFVRKRPKPRAIVNDPVEAAVRELASRLDSTTEGPKP